jgi:Ser/Thr protein kinase RdoA (MazF antagonist)
MNANHFPVAKSFLSQEALARQVEAEYGLDGARCQLITGSLRDVYRVRSRSGQHVLYVYRHDQRSPKAIEAEWQFVAYLDVGGIPVAPAVPARSGEIILTFQAPEGPRYGVLTAYVEGDHLRHRRSLGAAEIFGRLIARIHVLADAMPFDLRRPPHDLERIVDRSVAALAAEFPERAEDLAYLREAADTLHARIRALPREAPEYGMIHGDVIRANAQVSEDGRVTVLDFDLCGPGWRAYDVASYRIVVRDAPGEDGSEGAFMRGYQQVRPLTAWEHESMALFEAVRALFSVGVPAMNVYHWGSAYLRFFLDDYLARIRLAMDRIA